MKGSVKESICTQLMENSMTIRSYVKDVIPVAKELFDKKFSLEEHCRNGTLVYENEIITPNDGIYNILYLPFNETRIDKQEQIKISNDRDKITIIIKNDSENPEVTLEIFEIKDNEPEKKISSETNTTNVIYRSEKILGKLSVLKDFNTVYSPRDFTK